jgi:hypothetical protein
MTKKERVQRAIRFGQPDRIPVYHFNFNQTRGDILAFGLSLGDGNCSEWGFMWEKMDDGTMGQPGDPVIAEWEDFKNYQFPQLNKKARLKNLPAFRAQVADHYQIASIGITGFNIYTFIRGFENSMIDFMLEPEKSIALLDQIMEFEMQLVRLAAENQFDAVHFGDDWGTQESLIISPKTWREIFRPRYHRQFALARHLGLDVWFHSCGCVTEIVPDFHEIGVDVMNISQPNVVDLKKIGQQLKGKQCFMVPISYQTVSISGTREEILAEGRRLYQHLGTPAGGFIGYVEEYSSVGMSPENYQSTIDAFTCLNP